MIPVRIHVPYSPDRPPTHDRVVESWDLVRARFRVTYPCAITIVHRTPPGAVIVEDPESGPLPEEIVEVALLGLIKGSRTPVRHRAEDSANEAVPYEVVVEIAPTGAA